MCPQSEGLRRSFGSIAPECLGRILDQAAGGLQQVSLHFAGEPLLHKEIAGLVRMVSLRGIPTVMHSNGVLMTKETAGELLDAGLSQIVFSFDAVPPEEYPLKRPPATLDKAVAGIRSMLETKKARNSRWPLVTIKSIVFYQHDSKLEPSLEVRSYFKNFPVDNYALEYAHTFAGEFAENVEGNSRYEFVRERGVGTCIMPWYGFAVGWDGTAYTCCNDLNGEYILGNIDSESIGDIWHGEPMLKLRRKISSGNIQEIPVCSSCAARTSFSPRSIMAEGTKYVIKHILRPAILPKRMKTGLI